MMLSNFPQVLALPLAIGILLTGCNKAEETTTADHSESAAADIQADAAPQSSTDKDVEVIDTQVDDTDDKATISSDNQGNQGVTETASDSTAPAADTPTQPSVGLQTAKAIVIPMAKTTMQLTAQGYASVLTEDEKRCLLSDDYANAVAKTQRYLQDNMNSDELVVTDNFYASAIGQKLSEVTMQQSDLVVGKSVANPTELTPSDQAKIQEFLQGDAGQKLAQIFSPDKEQQVTSTILEPSIQDTIKRCDVSDKVN